MRSITIDIINEKALNLLRDMELLKLIRLRKEKPEGKRSALNWSKYKGAMSKEPISEVDHQLNDLRSDWE